MSDKNDLNPDRLIEVNWGDDAEVQYSVDLSIMANNNPDVGKYTTYLANEKIALHSLTSQVDKKDHSMMIQLTIELSSTMTLSKIIARLRQLPNIVEVNRR